MTTDADDVLRRYVLQPDAFSGHLIPKRIPRTEAVTFVKAEVTPRASLKSLVRLELLVNYHVLQEVCGHLFTLLPPAPIAAPGDVARGAVVARTIAFNCGPAEIQRSAEYSHGLIAAAHTSADIAELMGLEDRLGPSYANPALLAGRIQQLRASAASRSTSNYQAGLELAKLDEMLGLRLLRVNSANQVKAQVLNMSDRQKRIWEEIKMYLTLEHGYLEYLTPWAAMRLRRETWGPQPAEQWTRREDPQLRAELAHMFRAVAGRLEKMRDVPPENVPSLRVRCYRAMLFFGDTLSPAEDAFVQEHAGRQADQLSYD